MTPYPQRSQGRPQENGTVSNVPVVDDLLGDFGMDTSASVPAPNATAAAPAAPTGATGGIEDLLGGLSVGGPGPNPAVAAPVDPFSSFGGSAPATASPAALVAAAPLPELLGAAAG